MNKCLLIVSAFYPPERGAAPSRIANTALQMKKQGWDVKVITFMPSYPTGSVFDEYKQKITLLERINDIECKRFWSLPSNSNNPFVRVFSMLTQTLSSLFGFNYIRRIKPDLVLIQTPPLLSAFGMTALCRVMKLPYVANVSDIWPLTALELGVVKKGLVYSIFEKMESFIYNNARGIVAQSDETQAYLRQRNLPSTLVYRNLPAITPPSDSDITGNNNQSDIQSGNQSDNHGDNQPVKKIVYAGLLGLAQNVQKICETVDFARLKVEFHIYGDGVQRNAIAEIAAVKSEIVLHESVHPTTLNKMLPGFDATIIPLGRHITGAFPSKIYMAMAVPLPILFSGDGDGFKIVEQLGLGWASPAGDYAKLEENLAIFSALPAKSIVDLKHNIRNVNSQHFNFDREQDKLHQYLTSLI